MRIEARIAICLNEKFCLSPTFGYLLKVNKRIESSLSKSLNKVAEAERIVESPFDIERTTLTLQYEEPNRKIKRHAKRLVWLCKHSFFIARIYSKTYRPYFDNAIEATIAFHRLFPGKQQKDLCLPRMFFAATTSKRFKENGVGFIGAFLPSVQMHAWVIEDGKHADPWDNMWINYQPVAVIY